MRYNVSWLHAFRTSRGISLRYLSSLTGISKSTLSRYEHSGFISNFENYKSLLKVFVVLL